MAILMHTMREYRLHAAIVPAQTRYEHLSGTNVDAIGAFWAVNNSERGNSIYILCGGEQPGVFFITSFVTHHSAHYGVSSHHTSFCNLLDSNGFGRRPV